MSGSFDPAQLTLLQRVVDIAVAELGILDENEKALVAGRVVRAAERGEWDFDILMKAAKGHFAYTV